MQDLGKILMIPKGDYEGLTTYEFLDVVNHNESSWICKKECRGQEPSDANVEYWQKIGTAVDLQPILNGTTQVGNAKTLDGHEAEYFFPKSGGTIDGDTVVKGYKIALENPAKSVGIRVYDNGTAELYDYKNAKNILRNTADGTNTFNGVASGNLPLTGGTITGIPYFGNKKKFMSWHDNDLLMGVYNSETDTANSTRLQVGNSTGFDLNNALLLSRVVNGAETKYQVLHTGNMASHVLPLTGGRISANSTAPLALQATNASDTLIIPLYNSNEENFGTLGFRQGKPIFRVGSSAWYEALHTGNKPTGTYTGNGDATERTIATGGTGLGCLIKGNGYGFFATHSGGICFGANSLTYIPGLKFQEGSLIIATDSLVNASGKGYTYNVI